MEASSFQCASCSRSIRVDDPLPASQIPCSCGAAVVVPGEPDLELTVAHLNRPVTSSRRIALLTLAAHFPGRAPDILLSVADTDPSPELRALARSTLATLRNAVSPVPPPPAAGPATACPSCKEEVTLVPDASGTLHCGSCGAAVPPGDAGPRTAGAIPETMDGAPVPPAQVATPLPFGAAFLEQYQLVRTLGHGGMGVVYLMRQVKLERLVAVKVVRSQDLSPEQVRGLLKEARVLAGLNHPNVLNVFDVGGETDVPYMVCEYVDGESLADRLRRESPLPIGIALMLVTQVLDGLKCAHDAGIIHRDLKPDNVLLTRGGRPKIGDFGLAKDTVAGTASSAGRIMGTPRYMSPEQCQGMPTTPASDIYSIGIILYQMLTGETPFRGPTAPDFFYQHVREAPRSPSGIVPGLPAPIDAIVLQALEKDPAKRFAGVEELSRALIEVYQLLSVSSRGPGGDARAGAGGAGGPSGIASGSQRRIGSFELLTKLGQGGMGVVYRAWQPSLGRQVALKCLLRGGDPKAEARFCREIQVLGRVEHPHLVKVYMSGQDGDQLYYAMELLEGATLATIHDQLLHRTASAAGIDLGRWRECLSQAFEESRSAERSVSTTATAAPPRSRPFQASRAGLTAPATMSGESYVRRMVELARQVASATHALHEAGVVHRDIKPGNVMVSPDGTVAVLMDLGLAQLSDEGTDRLTRTRQFVGTLRYASPEQVLAAGEVDRRSDVYSLGAMLWEVLTLKPLYGVTNQTATPEVMRRIQYDDAEPAPRHNAQVTQDLESILARCLEKNPVRRYATALALADDLGRFLAGEPVVARPVGRLGRAARWAWRRPGPAALAAVLGIVLPGLAGYAIWTWDRHHRVKVEHYATTVSRWGAPEGVGRLTDEQVRRRAVSYRLIRRGGRVEVRERINGSGTLIPQPEVFDRFARGERDSRDCRYEYRYLGDAAGRLAEEIACNRAGVVLWKLRYDGNLKQYTDRRGVPLQRTASGASMSRVTWTTDGFEQAFRYLDLNENPKPDALGMYGEHRKLDPLGFPVLATALSEDGRPTMLRDGYARTRMTCSPTGELIAKELFDLAGNPTTDRTGMASLKIRRDEWGNAVELATYSAEETPLVRDGFFRSLVKHDGSGNPVEVRFLGPAGQPAMSVAGFARVTRTCDARGHFTLTEYFDAEDRPVVSRQGFARVAQQFDDRGNTLGERYFGLDGRPALHVDGYASFRAAYDDLGQRTLEEFFGVDGKPALHKDGFARIARSFDERGNLVEDRLFGVDGKPTLGPDGSARATLRRDRRGNVLDEAHFGTDEKPIMLSAGYTSTTARYDDAGHEIERSYHGLDGRLVVTQDGHARVTKTYDDRGYLRDERTFDADGRCTLHRDGYARMTRTVDGRGNEVERAYFDCDDRPIATVDGVARGTLRYDERRNVVEEAWFGVDGKPAVNTSKDRGYARVTRSFDERWNKTGESYFGADGQPVTVAEGASRIAWSHDRWGRLTRETRFAPHQDGQDRAVAAVTFDGRGNRVRQEFLGPDGKLAIHAPDGIAGWTAAHDDRSHPTEVTTLGADGQPMNSPDGYARVRHTYDARGNQTTSSMFGADGRPALTKQGTARVERSFDDRGNMIEERALGLDGKLELRADGFARVVVTRDSRGNPVDQRFFDTAGHPAIREGGYARCVQEFDSLGRRTQWAYYGPDDRPTLCAEGFFQGREVHDAAGRVVEESFFGVDGKPTLHEAGYAARRLRYDSRGHVIEEALHGPDGKLVAVHGVARTVWRYDARGNVVEQTHYGADGSPVSGPPARTR
jgi:serine/threonine protein kinase